MKLKTWHEEKPTKAQLDYIKHIWQESDVPLPQFTGTTRKDAAEWIQKHKGSRYHSKEG